MYYVALEAIVGLYCRFWFNLKNITSTEVTSLPSAYAVVWILRTAGTKSK